MLKIQSTKMMFSLLVSLNGLKDNWNSCHVFQSYLMPSLWPIPHHLQDHQYSIAMLWGVHHDSGNIISSSEIKQMLTLNTISPNETTQLLDRKQKRMQKINRSIRSQTYPVETLYQSCATLVQQFSIFNSWHILNSTPRDYDSLVLEWGGNSKF